MELEFARQVLEMEAKAIERLAARLDARFVDAAKLVLECRGRAIVTGMGKAGLIAQKISATLASTGTPSYSLHPAEALHGDLGRVVKEDVFLVLSNSGETEEVVRLIPHVRKLGAKVIAMTGRRESTLAKYADVLIDLGDIEEACPLGLAPTTSTSVMLAAGDALSLCVQRGRAFTAEEYARNHPAGSLGRKLLHVDEIMRTGQRLATIAGSTPIKDALFAITEARSGAAIVVDAGGKIAGIFTDGDLRRALAQQGTDVLGRRIDAAMRRNPTTIRAGRLAAECVPLIREKRFNQLPVVDAEDRPVGMIEAQDLVAMGFV